MHSHTRVWIVLSLLLSTAGTYTSHATDKTPATHHALVIGELNFPRQDHTATLLPNGKVLIVGWNSNIAELFDPSTGMFTTTGTTHANHRQGLTATLLNNGMVLIAGGVSAQRVAELYDPATGLFTLTDSLKTVHSYHTATLLLNDKVLIAAGQDNAGPQTHAVAELYDPVSGAFTLTDTLTAHRSSHTATLLPNGKVLIAGGIQTTTPGSGIYLDSPELYDPSTGSWTAAPAMQVGRIGHSATLLTNGMVLVGGGAWNVNSCQLYNAVQSTWVPTGPMAVIRRSHHSATLLTDGRVLFAGGSIDNPTGTLEVYDPGLNTFSSRDSMTTPRMQHRATRLNSGDVLITGGYDGSATLKSALLIDGSVPTAIDFDDPAGASPTPQRSLALAQNYPNPFNPSTTIGYRVSGPQAEVVRLVVYDLLGREVAVLVNEKKSPGEHVVEFDAAGLGSGVYLYRLQVHGSISASARDSRDRVGGEVATKRMTLIR